MWLVKISFFPPTIICPMSAFKWWKDNCIDICSIIATSICLIILISSFGVFCLSTGNSVLSARVRVVVLCLGRIQSARTKNRPVALHLRFVYSVYSTMLEFSVNHSVICVWFFPPHFSSPIWSFPWTYDCCQPGRVKAFLILLCNTHWEKSYLPFS